MSDFAGSPAKKRKLTDIVDARDRAELVEGFTKLRKPVDVLRTEVRLGTREPHAIALLIARRLPRDASGAFLVQLVDLASIHRSERWSELLQDFERAASEWRRTFDAVELPIVIVDGELRVTRINRSARMFVGKQYAEIIGHGIGELGSTEPWRAIADLSKQVQQTRSPGARQVKDASERTLDVLAMLFNTDDATDDRVIAIVWDVSALIDLQTRLEQQRTMATMGALVAGVAHEVRNPLFAISATVDAMETIAGLELKEYFEVLREEIDRMTGLMQDLLAYGRPTAPVFEETTVGEVVESAIRASNVLALRQKVTLRKEVDGNARIVADSARLTRALQNLIDNAIQHSPAESEVVVTAAPRKRGREATLEIRVVDHGSGFAADVAGRVFEPFFSRRRGGTGLGMSLVQQIVTEHGGVVAVGNAREGGGEVTINLPLPR